MQLHCECRRHFTAPARLCWRYHQKLSFCLLCCWPNATALFQTEYIARFLDPADFIYQEKKLKMNLAISSMQSPFFRVILSVPVTGWLIQPGTIICSQFKMKFLLVLSQIAPSVKASLCGLARRLPACPSSASASELPTSLFSAHTPPDTHPTVMVPHVCRLGAGTRHQPWSSSSPVCDPCPAGVLLLQLSVPEQTGKDTIVSTENLRETLAISM